MFEISAERARQICTAAGLTTTEIAAARTRYAHETAMGQAPEIREAYRAGAAPDEIARDLGISSAWLRQHLAHLIDPADRAARRCAQAEARARSRPSVTVEDAQRDLRRGADLLGVVRILEQPPYARVAIAHGLCPASTIVWMFGTWRAAVESVGLQARVTGRTYRMTWTQARCEEAVRRLARAMGAWPTSGQYEVISRGRADLPSLRTLTARMGRWRLITAYALAELEAQAGRP